MSLAINCNDCNGLRSTVCISPVFVLVVGPVSRYEFTKKKHRTSRRPSTAEGRTRGTMRSNSTDKGPNLLYTTYTRQPAVTRGALRALARLANMNQMPTPGPRNLACSRPRLRVHRLDAAGPHDPIGLKIPGSGRRGGVAMPQMNASS